MKRRISALVVQYKKVLFTVHVCRFTFVVIVWVPRRKAEVVLEVSPLIQSPGRSASDTDTVLVH